MDDLRVTAVLHRAVVGIEPPTAQLVDGGIVRGRRRRRIRRAGELTSVGALVAALVSVIVLAVPDGRTSGSAAGVTSTAPVSPPPSATASATPSSMPGTEVVMTPQALLQTTLQLLPRPGTTSAYEGNSSLGNVSAAFVYDDRHGMARVAVSLDYPLRGGPLESPCNEITTCVHRPDGSTLAIYRGNGHPGHPEFPGKEWSITLLRPDGIAVTLTEWNSTDEKATTFTRDLPPFSVDEVVTMVADPTFSKEISQQRADSVASLFTPDPDPAAGPSGASNTGH